MSLAKLVPSPRNTRYFVATESLPHCLRANHSGNGQGTRGHLPFLVIN